MTDEANAVSTEEVVPVGIVDKAGAVLSLLVAVGPVIGLARLPLPATASTWTKLLRQNIEIRDHGLLS